MFPKKADHCCDIMKGILERGASALFYEPDIRRYSIKEIHKDTTGVTGNVIKYCPWCGEKLSASLGNQWEKTIIEECSIKPYDPKQKKLIPKEFLTDEWWKKRGL